MRNFPVSLFFLAVFFLQITHYNAFSSPSDLTNAELSIEAGKDLTFNFYQPSIDLNHQTNKYSNNLDYTIIENNWILRAVALPSGVEHQAYKRYWQNQLFLLLFPFHVFI